MKLYDILAELDQKIIEFNNAGFDTRHLCQASSKIIEFHNDNTDKEEYQKIK